MIAVSGRLQIRNWNDKDGSKRKSAEVVADNCYFADTKKDAESGGGTYTAPAYGGAYPETEAMLNRYGQTGIPVQPANDFAMLDVDDAQLPF
jgi:single-strand DNA-binding protein